MFERFTDHSRRVIVLAQDAAREMGHTQIRPEHLVVGLCAGEGLAAEAIVQAGVDVARLRERVAARYDSSPSAMKVDKVPFSAESKKCLELSLRAALGLGHGYIGTEHVFFGVQRQAETSGWDLGELLGVDPGAVNGALMERLGNTRPADTTRSPALRSSLARAQAKAGDSPMTTGDVFGGMLADPDSQVSRALGTLAIDPHQVLSALAAVDLEQTSDATPTPQRVAITVGERTTVISDPDIANALRDLSGEQVGRLIKNALRGLDTDHAPR